MDDSDTFSSARYHRKHHTLKTPTLTSDLHDTTSIALTIPSAGNGTCKQLLLISAATSIKVYVLRISRFDKWMNPTNLGRGYQHQCVLANILLDECQSHENPKVFLQAQTHATHRPTILSALSYSHNYTSFHWLKKNSALTTTIAGSHTLTQQTHKL